MNKVLNQFLKLCRIITLIIGFIFWIILYPYLFIRHRTTKDTGKKLTRHPNIAMIFIYKVIDDLYKNYTI